MLSDHPIAKCQLACFVLTGGAVLAALTFPADPVRAGQFGRLDPVQQQTLGLGIASLLFGVATLPLSDRSA